MFPENIDTHKRLREVALGGKKLGDMNSGTTFQQFMKQAQALAFHANIPNPRLLLALTYKQGLSPVGVPEVVYPPAEDEDNWGNLAYAANIMLDKAPEVWVVDGDKYEAID